ncbi:prepilin-type N-terminal cleavage/methylation domain-containing protein [Xanthomonas cerealis pv. cerealis]|uniref:Type II secretion system protein H n=3 Tax=Xanthomonas TaxID=338 RepID=A0A514EAN4_9XANT|nr:GspH/FimT family pseudopilin [Xanthomonas translucens]QDI03104.1 prepilin-type N-terminal cleavage/methylation domain-containing protein [Xanthomonas translucens pv. cerealis]UKE48495.1 GspH/FimT family pseudopilin [Xanthomonas translucens pv. cerealis]
MCVPEQRRLAVSRLRGFTLVELMVTVAVLAIIMALAFPSFTMLIRSNRLTSTANELVAALQVSRSEAVRLNGGVSLCRSDNGSTCASGGDWTHVLTVARDGTVLRTTTLRTGLSVSSSALDALGDKLTFNADGIARDSNGTPLNSDAVLVVCMPVTSPSDNVRSVSMSGGSRVSIARSSNGGQCSAQTAP